MEKVLLSGGRTAMDIRAGKKGTPYFKKDMKYYICMIVGILVPLSIITIVSLALLGVDLV